jgi:hypothetical protein
MIMKKTRIKIGIVLLLSVIGLTTTSFTAFSHSNEDTSIESTQGCHYGQCQAIAKSTGQQCRHCVSNSGDHYCWQHR